MINKILLMEFFKDDDIKVVDKDFYIKSQMKSDVIKYITILEEENERLNNIIDEFNEWLIGEKMMFYKSKDGERLIRYGETKSKWLELKEGEE